ncbi:hypothetical protein [Psychroflexus aestuariivivens]|nr:hypothetical protein [Psychroflexus aestuariivivens]
MLKNLYLYLFVISALLAVLIYFNGKKIIDKQESKIQELELEIEKLEAEN